MAKAYSMDLRERIVAARDTGEETQAVAQRFAVSPAWVRRLMQRRRETGRITPRDGKPGPKPKLAAYAERLRALVQERPDATLEELRRQLQVKVCLATLWSALRDLKLSFKKNPARRRTATP
jgi:transposase